MKKIIFIIALIFPVGVFADGDIDPNHRYAWTSNGAWIDFRPENNSVIVGDYTVTGYAWSPNFGWINFSPAGGGVKNDDSGGLSGSAWGENLGWIDFNDVSIDVNGYFHGVAKNEILGDIVFDRGAEYAVRTKWTTTTSLVRMSRSTGPKAPKGGYTLSINNGDLYTNSRVAEIKMNAGSDIAKVVVSNTRDFSKSITKQYKDSLDIDLCSDYQYYKDDCTFGEYEVFVKFKTRYGVESDVISEKISYVDTIPEKPAAIEVLESEAEEADNEEDTVAEDISATNSNQEEKEPVKKGGIFDILDVFIDSNESDFMDELVEADVAKEVFVKDEEQPVEDFIEVVDTTQTPEVVIINEIDVEEEVEDYSIAKNQNIEESTNKKDLEVSFPKLKNDAHNECLEADSIADLFDRKMIIGDVGCDVMALQQFLNSSGYTVADSGPGSKGNETGFFGRGTKNALISLQKENGINPSGSFGTGTRSYFENKYSSIDSPSLLQNFLSGLMSRFLSFFLRQEAVLVPSSDYSYEKLTYGESSNRISEIQKFLIESGYSKFLSASGVFDSDTADAIGRYQIDNGLLSSDSHPAYGFPGPGTQRMMFSK